MVVTGYLTDEAGAPVDLTTATGITLLFQTTGESGQTTTSRTATVGSTPAQGQFSYTVAAGDLTASGQLQIQAVVTFSASQIHADGFLRITVKNPL